MLRRAPYGDCARDAQRLGAPRSASPAGHAHAPACAHHSYLRPALRPAPRPSGLRRPGREAHDRLHLEIVLEAVLAPLATIARLLVAAERRVRVGGGAVQV